MFSSPREKANISLPSTTVRRNITQRRSRGRKEESDKDPQQLAMKRPKGRSRDREYQRRNIGGNINDDGRHDEHFIKAGCRLEGHEMLRRTKERMTAEMNRRTETRIALLSPPSPRQATALSPSNGVMGSTGDRTDAHAVQYADAFSSPGMLSSSKHARSVFLKAED